ncbi:Miniconductance mechanosensitive channel YbdG [Candidatus Kinetoplastibacterium sorsogonicusi]|uniref:Miniconductance mechanosensitive channel YbdG n=1 Tax=Candidatus Kinetoplastidibacterium kentomonadis TaxID=1576550 RepID=A0A3S7J9Q3_9PROT|nr:mechanosensitive ion channel domain-containing protein [Candidatus Kinetoplastibacterium sorsogonicusi]AWD32407.1 Miniconductance mechanosensitive channel YbdG [Candidatus Kinetoplastibacterium sorsogonicusi]
MSKYYKYITQFNYIETILWLFILVITSLLTKMIINKFISWFSKNKIILINDNKYYNKYLVQHNIYKNILYAVPCFVIFMGIEFVPNIGIMSVIISRISHVFIWYYIFAAFLGILNVFQDLYDSSARAQTQSIKNYIQIAKLLLIIICTILSLSILMDKSPLWMISGLGAISAVLLLVFKDTLLSLVASTQLITNDMLRIGDWIEMPQSNADGFIKDIALHTVKVQNWDNTITNIPTYKLFSETYRNYRNMFESGGRRIKRHIKIDINSIKCLDENEINSINNENFDIFLKFNINNKIQFSSFTNIAIFRDYIIFYLKSHKELRQDLPIIVRTLEPLSDGIPFEIYCFTSLTAWVEYERIQCGILDHMITMLPVLSLRPYQSLSGYDLRNKII